VLLRLFYLALTGIVTFLRLLPMSSTNKNIEIATLRHQLTVLQRQASRPRFTPADRAFLAALLHRSPRPMLRQLYLIVPPTSSCVGTAPCSAATTPAGSARSNPADHGRCAASEYSFFAWPTRTRTGATAGSMANSPA
jgi:hypothetical protein